MNRLRPLALPVRHHPAELPPARRTPLARLICALALPALLSACAAPVARPDHDAATPSADSARPGNGAAPAATPAGARPAPGAPGTPGAPGMPVAPAPQAGPAAGQPGQPGPTAAAQPAPGTPALRPFAELTRDAQRHDGFFPLWQKDDKVWIEIAPAQFEQPFLLSISRTRGLGERRVYGNWTLDDHLVRFRRIGNTVQLVASDPRFTSPDGTPLARALGQSFAESLLGASAVASQPRAERGSVLVELNPLLLSDIPGASTQFETLYRLPYSFDPRNSSLGRLRSSPEVTSVEVNAHYAVPRIPAGPATPPPPGTQLPSTPRNIADPRSFLIGYLYSLAPLPAQPMTPRAADDRVGHFNTARWDFADDPTDVRPPRKFFVNRWRLEKKDPAAELSEPVKPIVFYLDRNIPERYRDTVKAGVLEWNAAFERIGFRNALKAELAPEDADFDLADSRHASIRWFLDTEEGALAIGPSRTDPRTGEILDADIAVSQGWVTVPRRYAVEQTPRRPGGNPALADSDAYNAQALAGGLGHDHAQPGLLCEQASNALQELGFALELAELRGEIEPGSPEAEALVKQVLKDVITHEVGHTLGLRHNFRASTIWPLASIEKPEFAREKQISGSVMDYNAFNLPLEGEPWSAISMTGLGVYDYWAIEYAYKPLPADDEARQLADIAARGSVQPELAYGTDEEAQSLTGSGGEGYDPEVNTRDLGSDPLQFARRRIKLTRELLDRLQTKTLLPGESYDVLRRNVLGGLAQQTAAALIAAKYVGGVVYLRDHAGSPRAAYTPVPAARQREALRLVRDALFVPNAQGLKPEFVARLAQDGLIRGYDSPEPLSLNQAALAGQRAALDRLLSDGVAQRLLDAPLSAADPHDTLGLSELHLRLQDAIFAELASGADIPQQRRNLQREYLRRLADPLVRPAPSTPADVRSVARASATGLLARLRTARLGGLSPEARAHVQESAQLLDLALKAPIQRSSY
ncbi:zinc-dependent metalloprotease [Derxia lacustris]|uniref:zinc-dependent metalloprotease n=1 Tax=Derxia lacustris TaxID=764842 RepID=UPI00111C6168|nr:zinc-dependent metalloprotease [Derxia lacustris]